MTIFYKAGLRRKLPAYFLFTDLQFEIDFEMRRHISILKRGYIVLYMDILQKQIVSIRVLFLQYYDSHNER